MLLEFIRLLHACTMHWHQPDKSGTFLEKESEKS